MQQHKFRFRQHKYLCEHEVIKLGGEVPEVLPRAYKEIIRDEIGINGKPGVRVDMLKL